MKIESLVFLTKLNQINLHFRPLGYLKYKIKLYIDEQSIIYCPLYDKYLQQIKVPKDADLSQGIKLYAEPKMNPLDRKQNKIFSKSPKLEHSRMKDHNSATLQINPLQQLMRKKVPLVQYKFEKQFDQNRQQHQYTATEQNLLICTNEIQPLKSKRVKKTIDQLSLQSLLSSTHQQYFQSIAMKKRNFSELELHKETQLINFSRQFLEKDSLVNSRKSQFQRTQSSQQLFRDSRATLYQQQLEIQKHLGKLMIGQTSLRFINKKALKSEPMFQIQQSQFKKSQNQKKINFCKSQQSYFVLARNIRDSQKQKYQQTSFKDYFEGHDFTQFALQ